jgi:segregation and condensation protein B
MSLSLKAVIEGILYVFGEEGVTLQQFSDTLMMDQESLKELLNDMIQAYQNEESGIELLVFNDTYKFISKPLIHDYIQQMLQLSKSRQLSQSALETLAIIAYKQPVTRSQIEEIRGVGCDLMVKKLQSLDLIRESGRAETPGRPILYEVTEAFLDLFKLMSLSELPNLPEYESLSHENQLFE